MEARFGALMLKLIHQRSIARGLNRDGCCTFEKDKCSDDMDNW